MARDEVDAVTVRVHEAAAATGDDGGAGGGGRSGGGRRVAGGGGDLASLFGGGRLGGGDLGVLSVELIAWGSGGADIILQSAGSMT